MNANSNSANQKKKTTLYSGTRQAFKIILSCHSKMNDSKKNGHKPSTLKPGIFFRVPPTAYTSKMILHRNSSTANIHQIKRADLFHIKAKDQE
jgi:hypothetical protein